MIIWSDWYSNMIAYCMLVIQRITNKDMVQVRSRSKTQADLRRPGHAGCDLTAGEDAAGLVAVPKPVADRVRTADDGGHEQEYARHNSHADLLRERIDGRVGQ